MPPCGIYDTRYLLFQPFQCPCASLFNIPVLGAKASAKIQPFSIPPKFFFRFFPKIFQQRLDNRPLRTKKNLLRSPTKPHTGRKNRAARDEKSKKQAKNTQKQQKRVFLAVPQPFKPISTPKNSQLVNIPPPTSRPGGKPPR